MEACHRVYLKRSKAVTTRLRNQFIYNFKHIHTRTKRRCRPPGRTCARTQQLSALRLVNMAMPQSQHIDQLGFWPCRRF
eukprot:SAG25_NODE_1338_length_3267_cov_8.611111_5_plen_79_part_00